MKSIFLILFSFIYITSCMESKITFERFRELPSAGVVEKFQSEVTGIQIINNQLNITGTKLDEIDNVKITGPSGFEETFSIESKSQNSLIANPSRNFEFIADQVFSLLISNAYGQSSFTITVSPSNDSVGTLQIQDGAITAAKLNDMGAGIGQILKYDGTNWVGGDLSGLTYAGNWNANINDPDLTGGGNAGEYRIVNVAGGTDLGGGPGTNSWAIGDWAVWNDVDGRWEKIDNATNVQSFNGRFGPVLPEAGDYTWAQIDKTTSPIGTLSNVDTTDEAIGKILKFDGSNWIAGDDIFAEANSISSSEIVDNSITVEDIDFVSTEGIVVPLAPTNPTTPTAGQIFYNSSSNDMVFYDGTSWLSMNGSSGADDLGDHIATQDLDLGANKLVGNGGTEGISINASGRVGIGTTTPEVALDVNTGIINASAICDENNVNCLDLSAGVGGDASYGSSASSPINASYVDDSGNIGVGTVTPSEKLDVVGNIAVLGQAYAAQGTVSSGAVVDFDTGNVQVLQNVGGSTITLNNMKDGGAYTLIVTDTTQRTYSFSGCTSSHFRPANGDTTSGTQTIYNILKVTISTTTHCYISWSKGW